MVELWYRYISLSGDDVTSRRNVVVGRKRTVLRVDGGGSVGDGVVGERQIGQERVVPRGELHYCK